MQSSPSLTLDRLTWSLADNVKILTDHLTALNYPLPSFDHATPIYTLPGNASADAHMARYHILDLASNISHLAAGPSEYIIHLQTSACHQPFHELYQY